MFRTERVAAASKSPRSPAAQSRSFTVIAAAASGLSGDWPGGFAIRQRPFCHLMPSAPYSPGRRGFRG